MFKMASSIVNIIMRETDKNEKLKQNSTINKYKKKGCKL